MVKPERINERLVTEEASDAGYGGFVEDVEEVALERGVGAAFEGRLLDDGGAQKENKTIDVPLGHRSKVLLLHVGFHLALPLLEIPVISSAADGGFFEVLDGIGPQVPEDLFVWSIEPEAGAPRPFERQGNLLFSRLEFSCLLTHTAF